MRGWGTHGRCLSSSRLIFSSISIWYRRIYLCYRSCLSDIEQAVEFCKQHDDAELWNVLINYSLDKPYFIHYLLNNICTYVNPRILVEKIKACMQIDVLRESLLKIMRNYNPQFTNKKLLESTNFKIFQISLLEGCRLQFSDCFSHLLRKVKVDSSTSYF